MLRINIYILVCLLFSTSLKAQIKDIGLPFVTNYSRDDYRGGTQNWAIAEDDNGYIYTANNNGVLRFDGYSWDLFALPNGSVVRSVMYSNNKLYVGGYEEYGYFEYTSHGGFKYHSLSDQFVDGSENVGEVWRIYDTKYGVVFQSFNAVLVYTNNQIYNIAPKSTFGFSFFVDQNFYVVDRLKGLYVLQGKELSEIFLHDKFFGENEVNFMFTAPDNGYLLGTANKGVFKYDGVQLIPWDTEINKTLIDDQIYSAIELEEELIAVGTIQNGIYILNKSGEVLQHINRYKGLQNNTILSMHHDSHGNLWLGLDNGIDFVEISNPLSILNYCFNIETVYTTIKYKDYLYVGTNQGLFRKKLNEIKNAHLFADKFEQVRNTKGQVWKLKVVDETLICGHNYGTYLVEGDWAHQLSDNAGGWDYVNVPGEDDLMIAGTYTGLELFGKTESGGWKTLGKIRGVEISCRDIMFDEEGNLWVNHVYEGLIKIVFTKDYTETRSVTFFNNTHGLPELPYSISNINGELVISSKEGFFRFNEQTNRFLPNQNVSNLLNKILSTAKLYQDSFGDIWYFTEQNIGVYRLQEDASYLNISIPFKRIQGQFLASDYQHLYVLDNENVFIAGQGGLLHYNPEINKNFHEQYGCFIKSVRISSEDKDTMLFERVGLKNTIYSTVKKSIPYKFNSVAFSFTTPFFEAIGHNQYSYRLEGFDTEWSAWTSLNIKEYTNLREGTYSFEVVARNIYEQHSEVVKFDFVVKPPFVRSIFAFIIYVLMLLLICVLIIIYVKHRIQKTRDLEKIRHKKQLQESEYKFQEVTKEKEEKIEMLKGDKLKNEMRHKNMELANATMHLIQKNKFLTKLKGDLVQIWGDAKVESVKVDIKQIIRKIDKDFKNEQQFMLFDKYFDEVHQDFLNRLKQLHPVLTPNDLRLCSYLKMNLSTKEIAPLMNITVRGLEISRYRLRKKLEISREMNLTEYIMSV